MNWISVLLLAAAVSFDSLAIGITYGMADIKIPWFPRILLSLISALFLLVAMTLGSWITHYLSPGFAEILGGLILLLLGIYSLWRTLQQSKMQDQVAPNNHPHEQRKGYQPYIIYDVRIAFLGLIIHVIREPLAADYDRSKVISIQEALVLGFALALDALAAGIGAAILEFPAWPTALAVMIANFIFVSKGLNSGSFLRETTNLPLRWLPAIVIIFLGLLRIIA